MFVWGSILINALPMTRCFLTRTLVDAETVDVWRGPRFVFGDLTIGKTHMSCNSIGTGFQKN
jgi:hypothetical protein